MNSEDQTVQPGTGYASAKLRKTDEGWEVWVFDIEDKNPRWKRLTPIYRQRAYAESRARLYLACSTVSFYRYQVELNK